MPAGRHLTQNAAFPATVTLQTELGECPLIFHSQAWGVFSSCPVSTAESETPFPAAVSQALTVFVSLLSFWRTYLPYNTHTIGQQSQGTKFRFVSEQPQSLQIWERILAQDDHIKDPDFFLSLQRKKHTVQGEAVWLHYKTDKDALITKCWRLWGNCHPHHGANRHTDLGSSDNVFFCIEPWTIFFGSLQFNDILFVLDNKKSTCYPYHQKERKTTWPIYKRLLVPNAEIAGGIRCWSWGWMPYSPLEMCWVKWLAGKSVPSPTKTLRAANTAKMSPPCHSTMRKLTLYCPYAATGSNPSWTKTQKVNWNLHIQLSCNVCVPQCVLLINMVPRQNKEDIKTWASGLKTPLLSNVLWLKPL